MYYYGTEVTETIVVSSPYDKNELHAVMLTKSCDATTFRVNICCDADWEWEFWMDNPANYEIIKHAIMTSIVEYADFDDFEDLIELLDEIFWVEFKEILVNPEDCDGDCENCEFN